MHYHSLSVNYDSLTSKILNFNILASLCSQAGWSCPYTVMNPDRFSSEMSTLTTGNFSCLYCHVLTFLKITFSKKIQEHYKNLDQDQLSVGPDLDPNCLQRLSADDKFAASKERVKSNSQVYNHTLWINLHKTDMSYKLYENKK